MRAQTKTQNQTMVLRHGGETLVCTGARCPRGLLFFGERRWFVLESPRRDTNGGSETVVTVTSKLPFWKMMIFVLKRVRDTSGTR